MTTALPAILRQSMLDRIKRELARDPHIASPSTQRGYLRDLADFESWRKNEPMTKLLVEEYASALLAEGKAHTTINRHLAAIRWWANRVTDLAHEDLGLTRERRADIVEQAARVSQVEDVKGSRPQKGRHIPKGDLYVLLGVCANDRLPNGKRSPAGVRDAALIMVAWSTGLRRAEIAALQVGDVVASHGKWWRVIVRQGKGRKARDVPFQGEAKSRLREWLALRGKDDGPLFLPVLKSGIINHKHGKMSGTALCNILNRRVRQAGIADVTTWHDFRRTFAGSLLDVTDVVTVQKLMGHSSPETTGRYDRRPLRVREAALEKMEESLYG